MVQRWRLVNLTYRIIIINWDYPVAGSASPAELKKEKPRDLLWKIQAKIRRENKFIRKFRYEAKYA